MDQIKEALEPVIESLPEELRELWLVVLGAIALIILLPLAWYQRRFFRALVGLPHRPPRQEPKLDEDLAKLPPPPARIGPRRLMVLGVPARLRLVVIAPLGKGGSVNEAAVDDLLNQVRWGLAAISREDQAAIRFWPPQLSAHGFPAVFQRSIHGAGPDGQPSRWVLMAGPTPPRPRSLLLGLVLWTDEATNIGRLTVEHSQWIAGLNIEHVDGPEANLHEQNAPPAQITLPAAGSSRPEEHPHPVSKTNGVPPDSP
jgi:hypothetical protein